MSSIDGVVRVVVNLSGSNTPRRPQIIPINQNEEKYDAAAQVESQPPMDYDSRYVPLNGQPVLYAPQEWLDYGKRQKKKALRQYYQRQGELLHSYAQDKQKLAALTAIHHDATSIVDPDAHSPSSELAKKVHSVRKSDNMLAKISIALNVTLVMAKLASAILSGSLVVIGSLLDSSLDVTTGFVLYITNNAIRRSDFYHYPRGRSRLEPLAILIVSVIMGAVSMQMISKSIEMIAEHRIELEIETPTIVIMGATVVLKFAAMVICYMYKSHQALVMAMNHRNDCITNSIAIICAYLADRYWVYLDPIAAIAVGIFLLITWLRCGYRYVQFLSGKTAKPAFINRILNICVDHQPALKHVVAVYAYYFGTRFLVEVVATVDEDDERWPSAKKIFDVNERLQKKLEYLDEVERAFVTVERLPLHLYRRQVS